MADANVLQIYSPQKLWRTQVVTFLGSLPINPLLPPYNAKGDANTTGGGTDDTVALQAALTAIQTAGGGAMVLPRRFRITAPLTYSGSYLSLMGYGPGTGIVNDSATTDAFQLSGAGECIEFSNFEVRNNDSLTPSAGIAIKVTGTTALMKLLGLSLRNNFNSISIVGTSTGAVVLYPVMEDIDIRACRGMGIRLSNTVSPRMRTILIDGAGSTGTGLFLDNAVQDVWGDSISIESFQYSVHAQSSFGTFSGTFSRSTFDNASTACLQIDEGTNLTFGNDCYVSTIVAGASGAIIGGVATIGIAFDDCTFENTARYHIIVGPGATHTSISNNRFYNGSLETANTYDAVFFLANTNKFTFRNNTATNLTNPPFAGTQRYGLVVDVGTSDEYMITDNYLRGNATGGLADLGLGVNKVVANNLV